MARKRTATKWIVWHTAAHGKNGVDYDTTRDQIDAWHRHKGWECIGYHYVVRKDGTIEEGRPKHTIGAHVLGLNGQSVGICFSGHGDIAEHTEAQRHAGLELTRQLMDEYDVPLRRVIGHREVNGLVTAGKLPRKYRTSKTCPGRLVDMDEVRQQLEAAVPATQEYDPVRAQQLYEHLKEVYRLVKELGLEEAAYDELNAFRREPHVDAALAQRQAPEG